MQAEQDISAVQERVKKESAWIPLLRQEIGRVIVGQKYLVDRLIIGLLANGHVLLEGVPGLAKTLSIKTLSDALQTEFKRIQFTPDLLPADILGTLIYNPAAGEFTTKKGPIFANLILADEINRAPAKVQSALLEAMQEKQVTIGETTFPLQEPFLVLATENPVDQEGTYPLPEAQVDRFMLKVVIGYPTIEDEKKILDQQTSKQTFSRVNPVVTPDAILSARECVQDIYIDERVRDYIVQIVFATREPEKFNLKIKDYIQYGASPRATISLAMAAKAHAFLDGRGYVTPQDVKSIGEDVLRHRLIRTYEAEAEEISAEQLIADIFNAVPVP